MEYRWKLLDGIDGESIGTFSPDENVLQSDIMLDMTWSSNLTNVISILVVSFQKNSNFYTHTVALLQAPWVTQPFSLL